MKTLSRLVRRYVTAVFAIVLVVVAVNIAVFVGIVIHIGNDSARTRIPPLQRLANSFVASENGLPVLKEGIDADEWLAGCAFSMLLSDSGEILWRWNLPEALNHRYSLTETASFLHWYLADYPVFSYIGDCGLLVTGMPKGTYWRSNFYMDTPLVELLLSSFLPVLALDGALILAACLLLGLRSARPLHVVGRGVDELAEGRPISLPEHGMTGELAAKLNRASAHLQRQREDIAKRDSARTSWIAGVSHDIRTPLAVIALQAERLQSDSAIDEAQRSRAASILAQSGRIRSLIDDLNLTSKLQYGAQPLRRERVSAGPLLRRIVAGFLNGEEGDHLQIDLSVSAAAECAPLDADAALLERALRNLLHNSARHNPSGCAVRVTCEKAQEENLLRVTVADDGAGYPSAVLSALRTQDAPEGESAAEPGALSDAPHILGLHVVEQIVRAHGGSVAFSNASGAVAVICLPLSAMGAPSFV